MVDATVRAGRYSVTIGPGLVARIAPMIRAAAPAHRYAVISDDVVAPLYAASVANQLGTEVFTIPAGEAHKTRESWSRLTDALFDARFGRDTAIVGVGGGVVTDIAGFVASTFMRGVPVVHVPTTLLAMIDAALGGKTGVDTPRGKNLVGTFFPPAAVLIDPQTLATLEVAEFRAGLAEAVKHGIVADEQYFSWVERSVLPAVRDSTTAAVVNDETLSRLIRESVRIKTSVVASDEREHGVRKILNFGHTIGHAIEHASGFSLRHGEAVAIGMVVEARAGELAGITEHGTAERIERALNSAGLPTATPKSMSAEAVLDATSGDKKSRRGHTEYALPSRIGTMAGSESGYALPLEDDVVLRALG